jgi:hypothetical protein
MDMTGVGDDSSGRRIGRPWLIVGLTLAVGATLALVLSNDLRWLRLGIVAALWAAIIGAFLAVKYRKHAAHSEDAVAEAQAVYELELEREIAARREFELELEAEAKDRADEDSRNELDALRAEILALRESLQSLFGGEVLYERVALTAQATRMRSINEDRLVSGGEGKGKPAPAQLVAGKGKKTGDGDRPTELMERVVEQAPPAKSPAEKRRTINPTRSAPVRPKPLEVPIRRVSQGDGAGSTARAAQSVGEATQVQPAVEKPAQRPQQPAQRERPRPAQPQPTPVPPKPRSVPVAEQKPVPPKPVQQRPTERSRPVLAPVERGPRVEPEFTRPAMEGVERGRPAASVTSPAPKPKPAVPPPLPAERTAVVKSEDRVTELDRDWQPSWADETPSERSATDLSVVFPSRRNIPPVPPSPTKDVEDVAAARRRSHRSTDEQPAPMRSPVRPEVNPTLPESIREVQQQRSTGGRRRRADDEPSFSVPTSTPEPEPAPSEPERPASGGRRRRHDSETPRWQGLAEPEPANGSRHSSNGAHPTSGSHSKSSMEPVARNGSHGRRSAAARDTSYDELEPADAGSHASGRSVNELLAAHGAADFTPRRRRRAED